MTFSATPGADDSSSGQRPGSDRSLHGHLQSFDLKAEVSRLREEKEWQEVATQRHHLTQGRRPQHRLTGVKAAQADDHFAPGPISLSIQKGRIRFTVMDEVVGPKRDDAHVATREYTIR